MTERHWTIGEAARIGRVTVRTLHHYDAIGLLRPSLRTEAEYRLYTRDDLDRLHLIRLYRGVGMALADIGRLLDDPGFDRAAALRQHRDRLAALIDAQRTQLDALERMIAEEAMTPDQMFDGIPYEEEARRRWGDTPAFAESQRRTKRCSTADMARMKAELEDVEAELARLLAAGVAPDAPEAAAAAEAHRQHITRWFYDCSHDIHVGLAEMYLSDERFTEHYERRAAGLAAFVAAAIRANAQRG